MEKKIATIVICFMFVSFGLSAAIRAEDPNLATVFSYQGRLETAGSGDPLSGSYDFKFRVYDTPLVGTGIPIGDLMEVPNIPVTEGIFTVQLDPDPGGTAPNLFNGEVRYLEIDVRGKDDPNYFTISPRQRIHAAPYAITASSARWLRGRNSTEKVVYVDDSGNVGIGTTSPASILDIQDNAFMPIIKLTNMNATDGHVGILLNRTSSTSENSISFQENETELWKIGLDNSPTGSEGDFVIKTTNNNPAEFAVKSSGGAAEVVINGTIVSQNIVYKTADQVEKNAGLHSDNDLKFYMKANTKYQFEFIFFVYREDGHEIKFKLQGPSNTINLIAQTMETIERKGNIDDPYDSHAYCTRLTSPTYSHYHYQNMGGDYYTTCKIRGTIETGSNSGNLELQWGPVITNTNDNPMVYKGSYLIYREIP